MKKGNKLSIIVPTLNEEGNIFPLLKRIDRSLKKAGILYDVIFIDDNSNDATLEKIKAAQDSYPVTFYKKRGKKGKAFSILEGIKKCKSRTVCFIDADLQYPPEALVRMYHKSEKYGVVVANRKKQRPSILRRFVSKTNDYVIGKLILGFDVDVQSGLKMFKKEIGEMIDKSDITPWTFDMALLQTAKDLEYSIGEVDITFNKRISGSSKINLLSDSIEIVQAALRLKFKQFKAYPVKADRRVSTIGSGIFVNNKKYITHSTLAVEKSAVFVLANWQKIFLAMSLTLIVLGLVLSPLITLTIVVAVITFLYFIDLVFSVFVIKKSLESVPEIKIKDEDILNLDDKDLPVYSILCPLYKEANVLEEFLNSINNLSWPKDKLECILLLEKDDEDALEKINSLSLPDYIKVYVVPESQPKTKPKACNYGLQFASGDYVVIFDAEDKPEQDQLKKVYLGFKSVNEDVFCLQCKLNYYNTNHNILTRLFTSEYSLWFDIILPGLQSIEATIPLGGTSNHFRTGRLKKLHGWDPFNVTEDCDLGVRLFKDGYKTAIIDSTTWEEANSKTKSWIKQRSRWIKGYLQTYFVHTRQPLSFLKEYKSKALLFHLIIGMRVVFILLNPILWVTTISYFLFNSQVGPAIESVYITPVFYMAVFTLVAGNFIYFYNYMIGALMRQQWDVVKYVFLIPFYWIMASVAGYYAVYQLIRKPHYWEKTTHGLHTVKHKSLSNGFSDVSAVSFNNDVEKALPLGGLAAADISLNSLAKDGRNNLRVLILNWRDTRHIYAGGAEVYVQELARTWTKKGHSVTIFCGNDGKSPVYEKMNSVEIIRRGGLYTVYFWAFVNYLRRFRGNYDVVVDCSNGLPFFTPLYVGVAKVLLVHHVHKQVFKNYLKFPLSTLAIFIESKITPFIYRNQTLITVSESSRRDMEKIGMANAINAQVITPGVGWKTMLGIRKSKSPSIVYMGRVKEYKNIDIAIKAFKKVLKVIPDATFTIAGDGESLPELKKLAISLNVDKKVKFLGHVTEREKIRNLAKSWLAVQPSEYEGWGITVIEANACATPVVAFNVNGLKDSIINKKTGILVQNRSVRDYSNAIIGILSDPIIAKKMSDHSYKWAKQFDWEKSAERFLKVISSTAASTTKNREIDFTGQEPNLIYQTA